LFDNQRPLNIGLQNTTSKGTGLALYWDELELGLREWEVTEIPARRKSICYKTFPLICHDITLSRGCLIAGLPLILSERVEHHYKSMGWSLFYEIT